MVFFNTSFRYPSKVSLLEARLLIDLKKFDHNIPLKLKCFLKFLTFVRKYFSFLFDGSIIYLPKIVLEIFIKLFLTSEGA